MAQVQSPCTKILSSTNAATESMHISDTIRLMPKLPMHKKPIISFVMVLCKDKRSMYCILLCVTL